MFCNRRESLFNSVQLQRCAGFAGQLRVKYFFFIEIWKFFEIINNSLNNYVTLNLHLIKTFHDLITYKLQITLHEKFQVLYYCLGQNCFGNLEIFLQAFQHELLKKEI